MGDIKKYAHPELKIGDQDYRWCHKYAHDVVTGKIIAGKYIIAACQRHLDDLERDDVYFDVSAAKSIVLWFKFIPITDGIDVGKATKLFHWQIFLCCSLVAWKITETGLRKYKYAYVQVARKGGKALALDTPILTPKGYISMGELSIGDTVYGEDGKPTKIINESEVFTDHDCYEVEFSNGEKIIADANHLWKTTARINDVGAKTNKGHKLKKGKSLKTRVRTTTELFDTQRAGVRNDTNHSISIAKPVKHKKKELPIDPYILGVWLGDGAKDGCRVTCSKEDLPFLMGEIKRSGYFFSEPRKTNTAFNLNIYHPSTPVKYDTVGRLKNKLPEILKSLGLFGDKHIPDIYSLASVEQRIALLQGLMDTDGYIDSRGRLEFVQKDKRLSHQVYELLCSLGVKPRIREKKASCNGVDAGVVYRIAFCCNKSALQAFRMPRKLNRMVDGCATKISQRSTSVQIVNVKRMDSVPTKCIQVDNSSSLFLCGKSNIPTHNSTLAGGLTLYFMYKSGYFRPRAYSVATKRDQAKILWSAAKVMIKLSPRLKSIFDPRASDILLPSLEGEFKPLASDSNSLDGLNPLIASLDECHAIKNRDLYGVMVSAFGAQPEGLMLTITTAGTVLDGICTDLNKAGKQVLGGERAQDAYFYMLYEIDKGDEWDDEKNWYKANPALGHQPSIDYLRDRCIEAQMSAAEKANFLTKHLNVFVSGADKWLDIDEVQACRFDKTILDYLGRKCYVGLDRAQVHDLTSFCVLFPNDQGGADCFYKNFLPKKTVQNSTDHLKQVYLKAVSDGNLELLETTTVRDEPIVEFIRWVYESFDVEMIGYDPWHMKEIAEDLEEEGLPMVAVSQGTGNMSEPAKKLEGLIKEGTFRYNDSLLEFAASNAILKVTDQNNVKVVRENPKTDKIDPLISTIITLSCATLQKVDANIYEERGML